MKYCEKCRVTVTNETEGCPLCGAMLAEKNDIPCKNTYPVVLENYYRYNFVVRLLLFISISLAVIALLIDWLTPPSGMGWSFIACVGILYLWLTVAFSLRTNKNFALNYAVQILSISLLLYVIGLNTARHGWALDYVIPFLLIQATLGISLLMIIKRMRWNDYLLAQLVIAGFGLLPVVLIPFDVIDVTWPAICSAAYSLLTFTCTAIFADRSVKHELKKRFHI